MHFNIDVAIIVIFLTVNLGVGLYYGKGITTIRQYAIGDRNFSTAAIAATIIATWISGSDFAVAVSETYKEGLWYLVAGAGDVITLLVYAYLFGPRMREFFGSLSVAESMGDLYGKKIRVITALSSIAQSVGQIAMQIKVFSTIFSHFMGFSDLYATLVSSTIVIVYSSWGGIKAVTFTDVIQFFTFGIFIPIFALFIWHLFGQGAFTAEAFATNPLLDYHQLIDTNHPKFWPYFFLLLYFSIPSLNSTMFQRILMAKDTKQVTRSFTIAAFVALGIHLLASFIGLVVLSYNPNLEPNNVMMYMVDNYSFTGLKGITIIGVMAMIMSTADSWINTGAVIFTNDFCAPLGLKVKNELLISRIFAVVIGVAAVILALSATNLLKLLLLSANFYKPIVTVPLILAILGFRSTPKAVGIGMIAGASCVVIWKNYMAHTEIDSVIPAMFANLVFFVGSHYLLTQKGGWVGIKDDRDLKELRGTRSRSLQYIVVFFKKLPQLDIRQHCNKFLPKIDATYSYFAFGSLLSVLTSFTLAKDIYLQNVILVNVLQIIALFISTAFFCRKLLPSSLFDSKSMGLVWYVSIFISLALISSLLVLMSKFSQIALIVFVLNLTMIGVLLTWQSALGMMIVGVVTASYLYEVFVGSPTVGEIYDLKIKIFYVILMVGGFVIAFLKPKQEHQELSDEKIDHLTNTIDDQKKELHRALDLKYEFLRNLQHETRTPITGITSIAQVIDEGYDKLPEAKKREAIRDMVRSSERLESYVNNLIDLSKLSTLRYDLTLKEANISNLVQTRLSKVSKLYIPEKQEYLREFVLDIEPGLIITCDEYYIGRTIENIIINAIQYCRKGKIEISLHQVNDGIKLTVKDEGVGIPKEYLKDIFGAFTTSAKTKTPAGGKGVGLALAKTVVDLHDGSIVVQSDGESWTRLELFLKS